MNVLAAGNCREKCSQEVPSVKLCARSINNISQGDYYIIKVNREQECNFRKVISVRAFVVQFLETVMKILFSLRASSRLGHLVERTLID